MSYCRWGDKSDIYVYEDVHGGWTCCGCKTVPTRSAMIEHMLMHRAEGLLVPEGAVEHLRAEIATVGDEWDPADE